jgi:hypothetical protein
MKDTDLLKKLNLPTHINYICQYITKEDMQTTKAQIDRLISENLIKEHSFKGYYYKVD